MNLSMRYLFYRVIAFFLFILCSPFLAVCLIFVKLDSNGPFLFKQKRMGKGKKPFTIYKIRTMRLGAEKLQARLRHKNEVIGGPAFKIRNDPRYTKVGKILSHSGLDEIPQLINVIKGEMSLVGPRPLPINEAKRIPKQYEKRFSLLPGMTSLWIVRGAHSLSFDQWMKLDLQYVKNPSLRKDIYILYKTGKMILKQVTG